MKKITLFPVFVFFLAFSSCTQELAEPEHYLSGGGYSISVTTDASTKVSSDFTDEGIDFIWSKNDELVGYLYETGSEITDEFLRGLTEYRFKIKEGVGTSSATFVCKELDPEVVFEEGKTYNLHVAYNPYYGDGCCLRSSYGVFTFRESLPSEFTYDPQDPLSSVSENISLVGSIGGITSETVPQFNLAHAKGILKIIVKNESGRPISISSIKFPSSSVECAYLLGRYYGESTSSIICQNPVDVSVGESIIFYVPILRMRIENEYGPYIYTVIESGGNEISFDKGRPNFQHFFEGNLYQTTLLMDSSIAAEAFDLSSAGTANSYIVNTPGKFKFNAAVKGGSTESLDGIPSIAAVMWESFGTDSAPKAGEIVKNALFKDGYITFNTSTELTNGNAVIAVKDVGGNVLWSWHIWICEGFDPVATQQVYNNNAGILMDRNLGATSATPGAACTAGLLYQWGRKDPFMGIGKDNYHLAVSSITWPDNVASDATTGTIEYAVAHPTTFITGEYDWMYDSDDTRWQTFDKTKGLFDPCPAGWRVPDGGENGVWATALGYSEQYTESDSQEWSIFRGSDFGSTFRTLGTGVIWYPETNFLLREGNFYNNCTINTWSSNFRKSFYSLWYGKMVRPVNICSAAEGNSVRCISESSTPIIAVTGVEITSLTRKVCTGKTLQLSVQVTPDNANVKTVFWSSSDESVATVSESGLVTGVSEGTCEITAKAYNGVSVKCDVSVVVPVFDYVDLGLSVNWATFNLGTGFPEGSGEYFAWGSVEGQTWNGASWSGGGFRRMDYELDAYNNLKLDYDAAHVLIGGKWRMPTKNEYDELIENCSPVWTNDYNGTGVKGMIFTSKKTGYTDKSIFIPAVGWGTGEFVSFNVVGRYWASSYFDENGAWKLDISNNNVCTFSEYVYFGLPIRPVYDPGMNSSGTIPSIIDDGQDDF